MSRRRLALAVICGVTGLAAACGGIARRAADAPHEPDAPAPPAATAPDTTASPTIVPHLVVRDVDAAIAFYEAAFDAVVAFRALGAGAGATAVHAQLRIGDSRVLLTAERPERGVVSPLALGGSPGSLTIYVADADAVHAAALAAGAQQTQPVAVRFWGDRYGAIVDPFGHHWGIATHVESLSPSQLEARAARAYGALDAGAAADEPGVPATGFRPRGYHTITPGLVVDDAAAAVDFYARVFDAEVVAVIAGPNGKVVHSQLRIGDSIVMVADAFPSSNGKSPETLAGTPFALAVHVADAGAVVARAVAAGAAPLADSDDAWWGQRRGQVIDPFGHRWRVVPRDGPPVAAR